MRVTPVLTPLRLGESDLPRSPGLHASDIFNDLYDSLEPDKKGWPEEPLRIAAEGGFQLERSIEAALRREGIKAFRPEERSFCGVAYSPDLFLYLPQDNGQMRVGEIKRKYMSSRDFPTTPTISMPSKVERNMEQCRWYCYCEGTTLARYFVEFVLGDYERPYMPQFKMWDIEFSERELHDTFDRLINHARTRGMLR